MTHSTVAPGWEWWVVWYFFLGGLAAGLYFIAALIELVGSERDREMAQVSYYLAFPLALVCGVLLILDLGRPERFWHMLIQSETGRLMFKYWSPISVGAWTLTVLSTSGWGWGASVIWCVPCTVDQQVLASHSCVRAWAFLSPHTPAYF